jgi:uncharacterized protein (UPF0332 family)
LRSTAGAEPRSVIRKKYEIIGEAGVAKLERVAAAQVPVRPEGPAGAESDEGSEFAVRYDADARLSEADHQSLCRVRLLRGQAAPRWFTIVMSMVLEEARKHLDLAKEQWESATCDAWGPEDAAGCVTNAFYAYENLIVAVAEAHGRKWEPNHYKKSKLAAQLFSEKILRTDVSGTILQMNDLRKDVSYGEPGFELAEADLEDIVSDLEIFLNEVESIVDTLEQEAEEEELEENE